MSKKLKRIMIIYTTAALMTLSVLAAVLYERDVNYRRAVNYSSNEVFETAVKATSDMSGALKKSLYATDGGMCAKICSEIYADALAAEAAISVLPFDTVELEQISGFINTAGDYAYSITAESAENGFGEEHAKQLHAMAETAGELADKLREMQSGIHNGTAVIDERQESLRNIGGDESPRLSEAMLEYEGEFPKAEPLSYDGRYTAEEEAQQGTLSEKEILAAAAKAAGVEERELKREYDYEGADERRCYSAGDMLICVSARGLEFMSRSGLVSGENIDGDAAAECAEKFLEEQGFENLTLTETEGGGGLIRLKYAAVQDGAVCVDNTLTVTVAQDDGSIYAFNAAEYSAEKAETEWNISEEKAREKLSGNLDLQQTRKVIIQSEGKRNMPCYEFSCTNEEGEPVKIFVSADSGRQCRIEA